MNIHRSSTIVSVFAVILPASALAGSGSDATIDNILALWPWLTGLILVLLAFLWYQQIRMWQRRKRGEVRTHRARGNQLTMLAIVSVFALLMVLAPNFLKRFERAIPQAEQPVIAPENRSEITLQVEGMTCTGCEAAVERRVGQMAGVEAVDADHVNKQTTVVYDNTLVDPAAIAQSITEAGYQVVTDMPE